MNSFSAGVLARPVDPTLLSDLTRVYTLQGRLDAVLALGPPRMLPLLQETVSYRSALAAITLEQVPYKEREAAGILLGRATATTREERNLLQIRAAHEDLPTIPLTLSLREAAEAIYRLAFDVPTIPPRTHIRKGGMLGGTPPLRDPVDAFIDLDLGPSRSTPAVLDEIERDSRHGAVDMPDPLLVIATTVFDVLSLRPFPDGNGRVARLLTVYLLRQAGFSFVDYVAIDPEYAGKGEYLFTFRRAHGGGRKGRPNIMIWWSYFLRMLRVAAQELDEYLTPGGDHTRAALVRQTILSLPPQFSVADIERALPTVSRTTINRVLRQMRINREIATVQTGRHALWRHGIPSDA